MSNYVEQYADGVTVEIRQLGNDARVFYPVVIGHRDSLRLEVSGERNGLGFAQALIRGKAWAKQVYEVLGELK